MPHVHHITLSTDGNKEFRLQRFKWYHTICMYVSWKKYLNIETALHYHLTYRMDEIYTQITKMIIIMNPF